MKIANIVYNDELVNHDRVDYINYYSNENGFNLINDDLPTLYVGWEFMKKHLLGQNKNINVDISDKRIITNQLYWEFSFNESKNSHIKGIEDFVKTAPDYYFSKYSYINLDPVFFNISDIEELINLIPREIDIIYQYKEEMLYIYSNLKITGINIGLYEFFNFNIKHLIETLKNRSFKYFDDESGDLYQLKYKIFPDYSRLKRYVGLLSSR